MAKSPVQRSVCQEQLDIIRRTKYRIEFIDWRDKKRRGYCYYDDRGVIINITNDLVSQFLQQVYFLKNPDRSEKAALQHSKRRSKKLSIADNLSLLRYLLGYQRIRSRVRTLSEIVFCRENGYRFRFCWLNHDRGSFRDQKRKVILFNLPLIISSTAIHELAHAEHDTWKENYVVRFEEITTRQLTNRQIGILARAVVKKHHSDHQKGYCPFKRLLKPSHLSTKKSRYST